MSHTSYILDLAVVAIKVGRCVCESIIGIIINTSYNVLWGVVLIRRPHIEDRFTISGYFALCLATPAVGLEICLRILLLKIDLVFQDDYFLITGVILQACGRMLDGISILNTVEFYADNILVLYELNLWFCLTRKTKSMNTSVAVSTNPNT